VTRDEKDKNCVTDISAIFVMTVIFVITYIDLGSPYVRMISSKKVPWMMIEGDAFSDSDSAYRRM
jgi:hypothetical protein